MVSSRVNGGVKEVVVGNLRTCPTPVEARGKGVVDGIVKVLQRRVLGEDNGR
ncbi:hypothetical protein U1Q18_021308, partial [Sarracenia purpurea var. burkii]